MWFAAECPVAAWIEELTTATAGNLELWKTAFDCRRRVLASQTDVRKSIGAILTVSSAAATKTEATFVRRRAHQGRPFG
ncbi:MAG TPA: hypothetical protein VF175_03275 [Lacipirellula sp.]